MPASFCTFCVICFFFLGFGFPQALKSAKWLREPRSRPRVPKAVPENAVPDWAPTGSRQGPTGTQPDPDWMSRTPISHHLPPNHPHVLSQTRATQFIPICLHAYIRAWCSLACLEAPMLRSECAWWTRHSGFEQSIWRILKAHWEIEVQRIQWNKLVSIRVTWFHLPPRDPIPNAPPFHGATPSGRALFGFWKNCDCSCSKYWV